MKKSIPSLGLLFAATANAQQGAYAQCGGQGFTGDTTCVAGYHCVASNTYYSQCLPGTAVSSTTLTTVASTTTTTPSSSTSTAAATATGFRWFGVSESCAEFGSGTYPGVYGKDFTFASTDTIDTLISEGYNIFRFPFAMERMAVGSITASLDAAYLANYSVAVNHVTDKGGYAIIDPHNYGRYNGAIITDTDSFQTFWANLATAFKSNANVIFDTNNEYHDMDISLVYDLNQAAIDGIRGTGATSQYIFAEGDAYSAAMVWNTTDDSLKGLTDPEDKLVYEMHLYLDSDNSGTSSTCYSTTVGVDRAVGATEWLRANGKLGILGEFAGGANSDCLTAVTGLVNHLQDNSDVWTGALWWAAGPWWGDYIYSFEPPSGTGYNYYDSTLKAYAPGV